MTERPSLVPVLVYAAQLCGARLDIVETNTGVILSSSRSEDAEKTAGQSKEIPRHPDFQLQASPAIPPALLDSCAHLVAHVLDVFSHVEEQENEITRLTEVDHLRRNSVALTSHELRNPLAILTGYMALLEEGAFGPINEKLQEIVPEINQTLVHINQLVDVMLESARLDDKRLALSCHRLDLRDVAHRAIRTLTPLLKPTQTITCTFPDQPVWVLGDSPRLEIVVRNLLSNAIKYSPRGGEIRCEIKESPDLVCLAVSDPGVGIAAEDIPVLFTRFGRIETPETAGVSGTGLGLHLSRELIRLHGGDVTVSSSAGAGTTFTVLLPTLDNATLQLPQSQLRTVTSA